MIDIGIINSHINKIGYITFHATRDGTTGPNSFVAPTIKRVALMTRRHRIRIQRIWWEVAWLMSSGTF
jgi:hypothetical protein